MYHIKVINVLDNAKEGSDLFEFEIKITPDVYSTFGGTQLGWRFLFHKKILPIKNIVSIKFKTVNDNVHQSKHLRDLSFGISIC